MGKKPDSIYQFQADIENRLHDAGARQELHQTVRHKLP